MKLIFDQNLSPRLPRLLNDLYDGSVHVREVGLHESNDTAAWLYDFYNQTARTGDAAESDTARPGCVSPPAQPGRAVSPSGSLTVEIVLYAKSHGCAVVSKDSDFQQRSLLLGAPPKFIWLRLGNCSVTESAELLRRHSASIHTFDLDTTQSHLMLP